MKKDNRFYVYALLDPRKPGKYKYGEYEFDYEPFYIGKGSGGRIKAHLSKSSLLFENEKNAIIKNIILNNKELLSIKILSGLSELNSLLLERLLISTIGKKLNDGILVNIKDGGDGPLSGGGKKTYKICPNTYNVIDTYESVYEASYENNVEASDISRCCLGRKGYVKRGGFLWSFTNTPIKNDTRVKKVNMLDHDGNIVKIFDSISDGARYVNKSKTNVLNCCIGDKISSGGFLWEYNNIELREKFEVKRMYIINYNKIIQLLNGEYIIHNSPKNAASYNNITNSYVVSICTNKSTTNTYHFEYFEPSRRKLYPK